MVRSVWHGESRMGQVSSAVGAGKVRRFSRFMGRDGRALLVAIDMQLASGDGPALDVVMDIARGGPDGILATWHLARRYSEAFARCGLVLRMDGGATFLGRASADDHLPLLYRAEEAARIGADAVVLMVYPGKDDEVRSLGQLATLVGECEQLGLPVVAESIPGGWGRDVPWDSEHIARAARVCVEIGADAIKTMAPPEVEDLERVVESCQVPLFVLGGPRRDSEDEAVDHARRVVEAGASGIVFGRNTWGAADPTAMVRRLYQAVHGRARVE